MGGSSWPSDDEFNWMRNKVAEMGGGRPQDVRVVVSPYRVCPLGAHIDHQGGSILAMTINKGILLGFIPSADSQVLLQSGQFEGEVRFRVDEDHHPRQSIKANNTENANDSVKVRDKRDWGNYARGALYALKQRGHHITKGVTGYICGSQGLDSSGLSSSAAVGVAYLLALESANGLNISSKDNIELDQIIENKYLGLKNGIMDQSAILLSRYGFLTHMNCKTRDYELIPSPNLHGDQQPQGQEAYKILLAFSGLKHSLAGTGYNSRVSECLEAAEILLSESGKKISNARLCDVEQNVYKDYKDKLEPHLAKRAEHYFSENMRVARGLEAWTSGDLERFGKLITESGHSSIDNYECGCQELMDLHKILVRAPGVFGARFSGAGFRGCCVALVNANHAVEAASFIWDAYCKSQPVCASKLTSETAVLICEPGNCAHII